MFKKLIRRISLKLQQNQQWFRNFIARLYKMRRLYDDIQRYHINRMMSPTSPSGNRVYTKYTNKMLRAANEVNKLKFWFMKSEYILIHKKRYNNSNINKK